MKTGIAILCLGLFLISIALANDETSNVTSSGTITYLPTEPAQTWTLSITEDGQLVINGKSIDRMRDPEIKAIMRDVADALKKQSQNDEWIRYYDQQTGYLLKELKACADRTDQVIEIALDCINKFDTYLGKVDKGIREIENILKPKEQREGGKP